MKHKVRGGLVKKLFWVVLAGLLSAVPARAAITAVSLGTHFQSTSGTNVLTTAGNACPTGSTIILFWSSVTTSSTLSSVADSAGNTWQTPIDNNTGNTVHLAFAYAVNTGSSLAIGGTITATNSLSAGTNVGAICGGGLATSSPLDKSGLFQTGASATSATTNSTGTLTLANELIVGGLAINNNSGTITCGGSFAKTVTSTTGPSFAICTLIVSSTASVGWNPSWVNANSYNDDLVTFEKPGAPTVSTRRALTGAGG
jgi:hypothetical protein